MRLIQLTQGKVTLVDDDLFDYLNQFKWTVLKDTNTFYAVRWTSRKDPPRCMIRMHHLIVGFPLNNNVIDHLDGNGLNNQRSNLKIKTHRGNQQNTHNHRNGKLIGAYFCKDPNRHKPWRSLITINDKRINLGNFLTEQEAHEAYLEALL